MTGRAAPTSPQFSEAIEALFSVAYTLKFMVKKGKGIDYGVMPLEGLWWVDDMTKFSRRPKRRVEMDGHDYASQIRFNGQCYFGG